MGRIQRMRAQARRAFNSSRLVLAAPRRGSGDGQPGSGRPAVAAREAVADEHPADHTDASDLPRLVASARSVTSRDDEDVPHGLRIAAAWSWRMLMVVAALAAALWVIGRLEQVAIPVAIALLLAALLSPAVVYLRDRVGLHRTLSAAIVMIGGLAVIAGTLTLVITQFVNSWGELSDKSQSGIHKIQEWLKRGPAHLSDQQLNSGLDAIQTWLKSHQSVLTTGAVATATTAVDVLASAFLIFFTTFFFLRDGHAIWTFLIRLLPRAVREPLGSAGEQSWRTLVAYVRATVLVAFIDALGIGIGLTVLRIDLAFPLAALVFLGAFIPIVGATLSGTVAILVALVTHGPFSAFLVLVVVILVQQLEGHVLQPLIMGRAVAIHPLAVIMAIATGVVLAGIIGALVAVPIVAVLNTGIRHLAARRANRPPPPPPEDVVVSA